MCISGREFLLASVLISIVLLSPSSFHGVAWWGSDELGSQVLVMNCTLFIMGSLWVVELLQ